MEAALDADADTREEALHNAFKTAYDKAWLMSLFEVPIAYGMVEDLDFVARPDRRIRFNDNFTWLK